MLKDDFSHIDEWGPEKVVTVADPRTACGVIVIDNTARGMGKGGTRLSPTLTVSEVARPARVMTWNGLRRGRPLLGVPGGEAAGV
jgi:glutamate dehydrogenase (NAD(P)+)